MFKKKLKYVDFLGVEREEDYYFNLTEQELVEMQLTTEGGYTELINKIVAAKDTAELSKLFKTLLDKSYGALSPDGRKFMKSEAILADFQATRAYSDIYMSLVSDPTGNAAAEFFDKVLPEKLQQNAKPATAEIAVQPALAMASM